MKKEKLIYVLPNYYRHTHEHIAHNLDLITEIAQKLDVFLIIEKGEIPDGITHLSGTYVMQHQESGINVPKVLEFMRLLFTLRAKGYKKLYVHYSNLATILGSLILRLTNGKIFYWHCYGDKNYFSSLRFQQNPDRYLTALALKATTSYVAGTRITGNTYAEIFRFSPQKIVLIPNWVNQHRFYKRSHVDMVFIKNEYGIPDSAKIVLFVHRLEQSRGVNELPFIAKEVSKVIPNILFVVVGDGALRQNLEATIENEGIGNLFKIMGGIPNTELPKFYAIADIFIMPSHTECFPRVVLEALATSIPMVVTDVGGMREILPTNYFNFIIRVGEWSLFAHQLCYLLSNPQLSEDLAHTGYKHYLQNFTLEKVLERFLAVVTSTKFMDKGQYDL